MKKLKRETLRTVILWVAIVALIVVGFATQVEVLSLSSLPIFGFLAVSNLKKNREKAKNLH